MTHPKDEADRPRGAGDPARFLTALGQELRTPLHGMSGALAALRGETDPIHRAKLLQALELSVERLAGTVDTIGDFAALQRGGFAAHPTSFPLVHLFMELANRARTLIAGESDLSVSVEVDDPEAWVLADPDRMVCVVMHLLRNAVQACPAGTIELSGELSGPTLAIEVRDPGPGVPGPHRDRIFEPFVQLFEGPRRDREGAGLGLTSARAIAEALGGDVRLVHPGPSGTVFRATFAVAPGEPAKKAHVIGARVLVVDDDRASRLVGAELVRGFGCQVETAAGGAEAMERLRAERFDLVFMDVEMPNTSGLDAARALRDQGIEVPIIAVSAYANPEDRLRSLEAGMTDFLAKPVGKGMLELALRRHAPRSTWGLTVKSDA